MFELRVFDNGLYSFDLDIDVLPVIGDIIDDELKVVSIDAIDEDTYKVEIQYI